MLSEKGWLNVMRFLMIMLFLITLFICCMSIIQYISTGGKIVYVFIPKY